MTLFTKLLSELAGGKKAPKMSLLPSEQALSDINEGMTGAHESMHRIAPKKPWISDQTRGMLGNIATGIGDNLQQDSMLPPPMTMGNPIRDNAIAQTQQLPTFRYGGHLRRDQWGIVGDGSDPNSQEAIKATDDGVDIVPLTAEQPIDVNQPEATYPSTSTRQPNEVLNDPRQLGEQYGLNQTEQPVTQNTARQPDNSTLVGDTTSGSGWDSWTPENRAQQQNDINRPATLEENYKALQDIQDQVIKHPSKWKNIGAAVVQSIDNSLNHKNQPVRTWDEIKADRKSAPILRNIQMQEHQRALETANRQKNARAAWDENRPQLEQEKLQQKADLAAQAQIDRIQALVEKHNLLSKDTYIDTAKDGSGRLVIVDKNGKSTLFKDPDSGEQLYNKLERPEPYQVEDGQNPDGTTKYRTVYGKGSQVMTAQNAKLYHEAMVALGTGRLAETTRHNTVTEEQTKLRDKSIADARSANIGLRQQEIQLRASGQTQEADKLKNKQDEFRKKLMVRVKAGEMTQQDFDDIFGESLGTGEVGMGEPTQ